MSAGTPFPAAFLVPAPTAGSPVSAHLRGRIAYLDAAGRETGREYFDLATIPDGHVLRALCVMDEVGLVRDVTLAMDSDWRPRDGLVRISSITEPESLLLFRVSADRVLVDARIGGVDRPQQSIPTKERLPYLGLHPLQGDALIVTQRGTDAPGSYRTIAAVTNSISPNGDQDVAAVAMTIDVAYLDTEEVEVKAGRFAARRYALRWKPEWPPAYLWVRAEDCLFLRMRWELAPGGFELAALEPSGAAG